MAKRRLVFPGAAVSMALVVLSGGCVGYGWGPGGMMGPGYGWGMGVGMLLVWIIVIVAVVLLVMLLVRQAAPPPPPPPAGPGFGPGPGPRTSRALEILEERYARGEITREQYQEMRRDLEGSGEPPPGPPGPAA